jgi:hypothetical protein
MGLSDKLKRRVSSQSFSIDGIRHNDLRLQI